MARLSCPCLSVILCVKRLRAPPMNVAQKSLISGTITSGFVAFGWFLSIVLAFATESKPRSSLLVRAEPWSYYAALGASVAIGICAAIGHFASPDRTQPHGAYSSSPLARHFSWQSSICADFIAAIAHFPSSCVTRFLQSIVA